MWQMWQTGNINSSTSDMHKGYIKGLLLKPCEMLAGIWTGCIVSFVDIFDVPNILLSGVKCRRMQDYAHGKLIKALRISIHSAKIRKSKIRRVLIKRNKFVSEIMNI